MSSSNLFKKAVIFYTLSFFAFMPVAEQKKRLVKAPAQNQDVLQTKQKGQNVKNPAKKNETQAKIQPTTLGTKPVKKQATAQKRVKVEATSPPAPFAKSKTRAQKRTKIEATSQAVVVTHSTKSVAKNKPAPVNHLTKAEKPKSQLELANTNQVGLKKQTKTQATSPTGLAVKHGSLKNQVTGQTHPTVEQTDQTVRSKELKKPTKGQSAVQTAFKKTIGESPSHKSPLQRELLSVPPLTDRFLEIGLEYPLNFGLHLKYLLNDNIYARFGFGFMPGFFLDSFESLSPSFGWLNEEEAKLIADTFENSMYLDFRLAWSPYFKESGGGPYLEVGLSRILFGKGELQGSQLKKVIEGNDFELKNYSAKTNTYNVTAHIGYQIPLEKLKLNIEVGLIKILFADVLSQSSLGYELLSQKQKEGFKNFLKQKGWIFPTVSGWLSFSF